jgi:flagellar biosynthetic protein FliP
METNMNIYGTEPNETGVPAAVSATVEQAATVSPKSDARFRRYLGAGWSFTRHLLEMVVAMMAGMVVLGAAVGLLGQPPAYADNALVEYALMGLFMSAPMVAWMRYRGHSWTDGMEMTAAMLVPMFALVLLVELGVVGLSEHSFMVLSHVAMIGGMAALMLFRPDRYVYGAHGQHA